MSTPAQCVSVRDSGERSRLVAPLRRTESSSWAEPVMAMAACRARERPRSSGSSLSRESAAPEKPRAVEVEGQAGLCGEAGSSDGAPAGAALGAEAAAERGSEAVAGAAVEVGAVAEAAASVAGVGRVLGAGWAAGVGR